MEVVNISPEDYVDMLDICISDKLWFQCCWGIQDKVMHVDLMGLRDREDMV